VGKHFFSTKGDGNEILNLPPHSFGVDLVDIMTMIMGQERFISLFLNDKYK
jgi:hypothetical protein